MMSVENLYWIIYENLLKPLGIDCWYYYPFGTKKYLSRQGEFQVWNPQCEHHALFHFDQEPLWNADMGTHYDMQFESWSNKVAKLLANSEKSVMKKDICRKRDFLDWYFFYHGFAALDWYRDAAHITVEYPIQNAFLSLNHLVTHKRCYRIALISKLLEAGAVASGAISMHAQFEDILDEIHNPHTLLCSQSKQNIRSNLDKFVSLPWLLDDVPIDGDMSARFGHQEFKLWQQSFLHVVNETVFYQPKLHLTEKIFKPIVAGRPFVLVGAPGNLAYLKSYGFLTFDHWIDETYDSIEDADARLCAIASEIVKLSRMPLSKLRSLHHEMRPILDHNRKLFFHGFRNQIVCELVDNFQTCIRIWNNGRIDGRQLRSHPDPESVKRLLLQ